MVVVVVVVVVLVKITVSAFFGLKGRFVLLVVVRRVLCDFEDALRSEVVVVVVGTVTAVMAIVAVVIITVIGIIVVVVVIAVQFVVVVNINRIAITGRVTTKVFSVAGK